MPKVSVIIPVYNTEKYLRECLDSVINQTLKDIEIICVDDGSPDNCGQIIDEYASKDERIVAIHKENGGYASAINYGLDIAKGEFIGIVESDDYCSLNMYEELYKNINNTAADFIVGDFYMISEKKIKRYKYSIGLKKDSSGYFNLKYSPSVLTKAAFPWKNLYRKKFLDDNNIKMLQDGVGSYEDQPWNITVIAKAKNIITLDKPIYYYRTDALGSSTNNGSRKLINYIKRRQQAKEILIKNNCFSDEVKEYFYLSAFNGGKTFYNNIAKEYKKEYYNEMKKLLSQAYDEGIKFKYFSKSKKRRYDRMNKFSYSKFIYTYYYYEILGFIKDVFKCSE